VVTAKLFRVTEFTKRGVNNKHTGYFFHGLLSSIDNLRQSDFYYLLGSPQHVESLMRLLLTVLKKTAVFPPISAFFYDRQCRGIIDDDSRNRQLILGRCCAEVLPVI
jgi:hypothetical protein